MVVMYKSKSNLRYEDRQKVQKPKVMEQSVPPFVNNKNASFEEQVSMGFGASNSPLQPLTIDKTAPNSPGSPLNPDSMNIGSPKILSQKDIQDILSEI